MTFEKTQFMTPEEMLDLRDQANPECFSNLFPDSLDSCPEFAYSLGKGCQYLSKGGGSCNNASIQARTEKFDCPFRGYLRANFDVKPQKSLNTNGDLD